MVTSIVQRLLMFVLRIGHPLHSTSFHSTLATPRHTGILASLLPPDLLP